MRTQGRRRSLEPSRGWFRRGDLILVAILLVLGSGTWLAVRLFKNSNSPTTVEVTTPQGKFEVALKDTLLVITGPLGNTEVRIQNGKVRVERATCPNKLCIRQGSIFEPNQSIVCLPNRIVITLKGRAKLDAVTY